LTKKFELFKKDHSHPSLGFSKKGAVWTADIRAQMGIPLGGGYVGMTQQLLDLVQASAMVNQQKCEIMPEIMNSHIRETCQAPDSIPGMMHMFYRPVSYRAGKDIFAAVDLSSGQNCQSPFR
jgi:hypothetical protein